MTNHRVLYFDDEPIISNAVVNSLGLLGWDVTFVSEIDELFKELNNNHYDALIMDIMAPTPSANNRYVTFTRKEIEDMNNGMNTGVVLTKKIITMPKYKGIPILFLSARKNPLPENPELNNCNCDYLRKPQLSRTVDIKLKELLNH